MGEDGAQLNYETMEEQRAREQREAEANPILAYIKELRQWAATARRQADGYEQKADLMEAQYNTLTKK